MARCSSFPLAARSLAGGTLLTILFMAATGITIARAADEIAAQPAPAACISSAQPCVTVPVVWTRTDATPVRGYSVTIQLSANLTLCGAQIASASYLLPGSSPPPLFVVTPLGGNAFTIDEATLGTPCGAVGSGTLFNLQLASASAGGTGTITLTSVKARDCNNVAVPATIGAVGSVTIDNVAPTPVVLSAAQKKIGNVPANSTTDVIVSWTGQEAGSTVAVYRKGFGGYPQYDENGGAAPLAPATPTAAVSAGWTLSTVTTSGAADRPGTRDFEYYAAFVTDACGNLGAVSNRTSGTLDYHLGDVHNGTADCTGDDAVNTSDISALGGHYGITIPVNGTFECLDVGPTTDLSVNARPSTDNKTDFEDLILFAINYGQVSMAQSMTPFAAATDDRLEIVVPTAPAIGQEFAVTLGFHGTGVVQGLSVQLGFDPAVVEFVGVSSGALLNAQRTPGVVFSARPGNVDVATLGTRAAIRGVGDLAVARFRVKAAGDPSIRLERAIARDARNADAPLALAAGVGIGAPSATALTRVYPNPMREGMTVQWSLSRAGSAHLAVYDLAGRRVRVLADGDYAAGVRTVGWDGRNDLGERVHAGFYAVRLRAGSVVETRTVRMLP